MTASGTCSSSKTLEGKCSPEWANNHGLFCENDAAIPTRPRPRLKQSKSSPDVTFSKNATITNWRTSPSHDSDRAIIRYNVMWGPEAEDHEELQYDRCSRHCLVGSAGPSAKRTGKDTPMSWKSSPRRQASARALGRDTESSATPCGQRLNTTFHAGVSKARARCRG